MWPLYIRWIAVLVIAALLGKLISKLKMPSILGWLIAGMLLGPNAAGMLSQTLMDSPVYKVIITWMQVSFGLMLGTELVFRKIKAYGKALLITTLTQSLGTFLVVSFVFGIIFPVAGLRHGRPVVYTIDSGRMSADGYDFFQSVNGVWLTKKVPPEYLHKYQ